MEDIQYVTIALRLEAEDERAWEKTWRECGTTMTFVFTPDASLAICKVDAPTQTIRDVYLCGTLSDVEATLSTGATVGTASFKLANDDGLLFANLDASPHAMDIACLALRNRYGQWGIAWTGVVDEPHQVIDPSSGDFFTLNCTSPQKYFEIRRQTAHDVVTLDVASMTGIRGSDLLRFACQPTRVNYPGPLAHLPLALNQPGPWKKLGWLGIDPAATTGVMNWNGGVPTGDFTQPDYQTWNAVLSPVARAGGLEWFFDECGRLIWRRPGFLADVSTAQPIPEDEIYSIDLSESDSTVVTRVEVRWGTQQNIQTAAWWQAPPAMVQQMTPRTVVIPAEWIWDPGAQVQAQNLATLLGDFYSANMLQGIVVVPANPAYRVGSLVQIPPLRGRPGGIYYVASILYKLTWGSGWVMVLGLQYGRNKAAQFPILGRQGYPTLIAPPNQQLGKVNNLADSSWNANAAQNVFTLVLKAGVLPDQLVADPSLVPVGALVRLRNAKQSVGTNGQPLRDQGALAGMSPTGSFTVLAGNVGQGYTLYVGNIGRYPQVLIDVQDPGTGVDPTLRGTLTGTLPYGINAVPNASAYRTMFPITSAGASASAKYLQHPPANLAQEAYALALSRIGYPYALGAPAKLSDQQYDCSGLVYWSYNTAGYPVPHLGPLGFYKYFLSRGAVEWPVTTPLPTDGSHAGDLLFYWNNYDSDWLKDNGNGHVGFYDGAGGIWAAMGQDIQPNIGGATDYAHQRSDAGGPLAHVLNMQGFGATSAVTPLSTSATGHFTIAQIASATGDSITAINAVWPLIYGALSLVGNGDTASQIAVIAITGEETDFVNYDESRNPDGTQNTGVLNQFGTYYGRGFVQLTGKDNYNYYTTLLNKTFGSGRPVYDLVNNPDQALEPDTAARIAALYLKYRGISAAAAASNWNLVYNLLNPGGSAFARFMSIVTALVVLG